MVVLLPIWAPQLGDGVLQVGVDDICDVLEESEDDFIVL